MQLYRMTRQALYAYIDKWSGSEYSGNMTERL